MTQSEHHSLRMCQVIAYFQHSQTSLFEPSIFDTFCFISKTECDHSLSRPTLFFHSLRVDPSDIPGVLRRGRLLTRPAQQSRRRPRACRGCTRRAERRVHRPRDGRTDRAFLPRRRVSADDANGRHGRMGMGGVFIRVGQGQRWGRHEIGRIFYNHHPFSTHTNTANVFSSSISFSSHHV
jgi:hypothetical protein